MGEPRVWSSNQSERDPMPLIDIDALLRPIESTAPCGPELDYDFEFVQLENAVRGKPEQQFGDTVIPAEEPEWQTVYTLATTLFTRTKDIRVAVILLRAAMHLHGPSEFDAGLRLIHALLVHFWDTVHPALDPDDPAGGTMRLNALAPLGNGGPVLADLRGMSFGGESPGITGLHVELVSDEESFDQVRGYHPLDAIWNALMEEQVRTPNLLECLRSAGQALQGIGTVLTERFGVYAYPDFGPLRRMVQVLAKAVQRAEVWFGDPPDDNADETKNRAGAPRACASLERATSRLNHEASTQLQRVCEWIEPGASAQSLPAMLRRARRLSSRSFVDIVRDLAPDRSNQIDGLADAFEPRS
jgi:type VI secretion system protein ImpA